MSRPAKPNTVPPRQHEGTRPRARDQNGYEIDEHGLPINGPARQRALDGRPDPATQPAADNIPPVEAGANATEE